MRNVIYSATPHQVTSSLAEILHGSGYAKFSPMPLNFHVRLFKDKKGIRNHSGCGALTLPTEEVGHWFLDEYGERPIAMGSCPRVCAIGSKRIKFTLSRNKARLDVLESIRRRPYMDPQIVREKERRDAVFRSENVLIQAIQFGWECRDSIFSIEWEQTFSESCFLLFDGDRRELRIKIPQVNSPNIAIIAQRFSQINSLSAHTLTYPSEEPVVFLSFDVPPVFELEVPGLPLRQRLSALPMAEHARVVPFTSLSLRLVLRSSHELSKFRVLCKVAQLHGIHNTEYLVDRRELFSAAKLEEIQRLIQRFDWCVSFQIEALLRNLLVDAKEMLELIPHIQTLVQNEREDYTSSMLRYFSLRAKEFCLTPDEVQAETIEECFLLAVKDFASYARSPPLQPTDESLFNSFHVTITPTSMFLDGPFPERSNRVVRRYDIVHHESFLRVSFVDEGRLRYQFDRDIDGPKFIRSRVGEFLLNGLTVAQREFQFLAYSQSALKEHSVWCVTRFFFLFVCPPHFRQFRFVKPFRVYSDAHEEVQVNAAAIIGNLGSFDNLAFDPELMYCPARYAARISQAFTATDASLSVEEAEEIFEIEDICVAANSRRYCFTDGVGTISKELAVAITQALRTKRRRPLRSKTYLRAFQVRFMGSKGMLSVDYKLQGRAICLRPSMIKFQAPESREIEIARVFDRPGTYFLNRPLIMLLEGLGVEYDVFKKYQDKAVRETQESTESLGRAARMLESHGLGASYRLPSIILGLEKLGIDNLIDNPFYQRMLEFAVYHILRLLKNRARIPVPNAWTLVGVADVHKYLKEGEIFACVKPIDKGIIYLEGPVLISRSPTIHPGDVQVVHAIGPPPAGSCFSKEALQNTVVFSVLGIEHGFVG